MRKSLILDTSVLLYDKESIHSFPGNDLILPFTVLDELDRKKEAPGLLGESARYVNRYLDDLRSLGRLDEGVLIEDIDQTIQILTQENLQPAKALGLDVGQGDNRIISVALCVKSEDTSKLVKVITKDINLRVKCDALGISAEDYYKDHLKAELADDEGTVTTIMIEDNRVTELHDSGFVEITDEEKSRYGLYENSSVVVTGNGGGSVLASYKNFGLTKSIPRGKFSAASVNPRNKEQHFALSALTDPNVPLVCLTGIAGSGKTFLTLLSALNALNEGLCDRIVVTRSIQPVGRDIGFLPGDLQEKMAPWMAPLVDNFRHAFKDLSYFNSMIDRGQIEIAPLSFIRGRTFNDAFIIVDEAQNATIHELKTIVTRIGENSKIVLMGDTDQVDTPYINSRSNGLSIIIDKLRESDLTCHVHLSKGERSKLATLASKTL